MEIIERPIGSTTYMLKFPAHVVKDVNELKNILSTNVGKKVVTLQKLIDPVSFCPQIAVMLYSNNININNINEIIDNEFYIITVGLTIDIQPFEYDIINGIITKKE